MKRVLLTITITALAFILGGWKSAIALWVGMIYFGCLTYKDEGDCE